MRSTTLARPVDVRKEGVDNRPTPVNLKGLFDYGVRDEVARNTQLVSVDEIAVWDADLDGIAEWIEICQRPLSQRSVVDLVEDIRRRLGLSLAAVLEGADIIYRTYHTWVSNPAIDPRVGSVGRLWDLATVVEDLEEHVADLNIWLADPGRQSLLTSGDFGALLDEAIRSRYPASQRLLPVEYTADDSVIEELEVRQPVPAPSDIRRATRVR